MQVNGILSALWYFDTCCFILSLILIDFLLRNVTIVSVIDESVATKCLFQASSTENHFVCNQGNGLAATFLISICVFFP